MTNDLNDVISSAVLARIEAEVAGALSGKGFIDQYVIAAINKEIEVKDRDYRTRKTTFLKESIDKSIQQATKAAIAKVIQEESAEIEKIVTTQLRKQVKTIAQGLTGQLVEAAKNAYGVNVEIRYPGYD